ncbi:guanine nucleotide exchange protein for ADP-robosylation factor [Umbelopsis nana]
MAASPSASTVNVSSSRSSLQSQTTTSSAVFLVNALEKIAAAREIRRNKQLKEAVQSALDVYKSNEPVPEGQNRFSLILAAMQGTIGTGSTNLVVIALDCLGKLISYNYVTSDPKAMESVVDLICECFVGEGTDEKVQLQIVKALLDAVLSTTSPVHQSSLLKAIRTTYNIFLLSRNSANQNIAQVTLTQMVHQVFGRVNTDAAPPSLNTNLSTSNLTTNGQPNGAASDDDTEATEAENSAQAAQGEDEHTRGGDSEAEKELKRQSLQDQIIAEAALARRETLNVADSKSPADILGDTEQVFEDESVPEALAGSSVQTREQVAPSDPVPTQEDHQADEKEGENTPAIDNPEAEDEADTVQNGEQRTSFEAESRAGYNSQDDLFAKDAFLVFRALCNLSMKPITTEGNDLKSYSMRSKLLSLHLISIILTSHHNVFTSPGVVLLSLQPNGATIATPFIQAAKKNLCVSLSRNAVSVTPQVFDISLEIFWKVVQNLRMYLKKEIEVFFTTIFLPILEMRNASYQQKHSLLNKVVLRICSDPQTLVEMYLNYDCDREALDNIYERLVNVLSRITTTHAVNLPSKDSPDHRHSLEPSSHLNGSSVVIPPKLTTDTIQPNEKHSGAANQPSESALKYKSLESLVAVLRSLVAWYNKGAVSVPTSTDDEVTPRESEDHQAMTGDGLTNHSNTSVPRLSPASSNPHIANGSTSAMDDPEQFESKKHRKQMQQEGIRQFNWKAKKGIQFLNKHGFINASDSVSVAKFLLHTDGLNKAMIGEYLGEGEQENIAIMHAFVDELNFIDMQFVDALRQFLQGFRLPGEAQKIDRFMLKFAERYLDGNPGTFANADTAYTLAYSVILLNTDQHSPQVKNPMTLEQFIKNNRGINDDGDLPDEMLESIYNDIKNNEIILKDEQEVASANALLSASSSPAGPLGMVGLQNALMNAGITRDVKGEAYQAVTEEMGSKTEALFKNMLGGGKRRRAAATGSGAITFYSASHIEHVRPMFEVAWMSFLAGISGPLQESDDSETVNLCLEGFQYAIRTICLFHTVQSEDMNLQRDAFVTTLTKFTFLTNYSEMKFKNVQAIKALLDVAATDGNHLKGSWKEILTTVSQLERFQLITSGVGGDQQAVDSTGKRGRSSASVDLSRRSTTLTANGRKLNRTNTVVTEEVATAGSSHSLVLAVDKLFTSTVNLNGEAIVDFVRALCETSWEEIISSSTMEHPRMYSLQKLVEISYYNMGRIRLEWSNVWAILGEHFNQVGCQSNFNIAFFALDSLRQLSMQFLEKEELAHFKFQKDFLMPFEYILANNQDVAIKDMVLRCLTQMIQARAHHIRSGWKTMFAVFAKGACESSESIVSMTFDIVRSLSVERFSDIVANGTFPDFVSCLSEFSKNHKFQKISLPALDMIKSTIPRMLELGNESQTIVINDANATAGRTVQSGEDFLIKFWFAILFGFKEVTMKSDDVEVRRKALQYLFETLKEHGVTFSPEFWNTVTRQIVFPLFEDLRPDSEHQRTMSDEDFSVWLSTTMIEALRSVVDLYSYYFDNMRDMMKHVLSLFSMCITQENDTLARIGCECLQQYIEANVEKFDTESWDMVTETFADLFEKTTAYSLFDDTKDLVEKSHESPSEQETVSEERQRGFQHIIMKCVLQLLLIQTVNDLLTRDTVYIAFPARHLMIVMDCLGKSFHFAERFNSDNELRMALWRFGFMKQLPNLLKQETSSGACYVANLMRMFANIENIADRDERREEIEQTLIPLCNEIFTLYSELDHETKPKNIAAWTPVVVSILTGLTNLQDQDFLRHLPQFYEASVNMLTQDNLIPEIRMVLRTLLLRVGKSYNISA